MIIYLQKSLATCFLFIVSLTIGSVMAQEQLAIVSVSGDKQLAVFEINDETGELTLKSRTETTDKPAAMCFNADKRCLYVVMKGSGALATFGINAEGKLKHMGDAEVGAAGSYLSLHPSGKFLLSSYYAAGQIAIHKINDDGALAIQPVQIVKTDERAHAIVSDPEGQYVFVPHTRPNKILQFVVDSETGKLNPNDSPYLLRNEDAGPRHLWFHPKGKFAYGSDEKSSSITAYRFDQTNGTLEVIETSSSLPEGDFEGKNKTTSDIEVHPSGEFVYIANRGVNLIAAFSIDQNTGKLTLLQHVETEATTRSFNVSPDGRFLIAGGQKSGRLATFRIGEDGKLERLNTIDVGKMPWWVTIVAGR